MNSILIVIVISILLSSFFIYYIENIVKIQYEQLLQSKLNEYIDKTKEENNKHNTCDCNQSNVNPNINSKVDLYLKKFILTDKEIRTINDILLNILSIIYDSRIILKDIYIKLSHVNHGDQEHDSLVTTINAISNSNTKLINNLKEQLHQIIAGSINPYKPDGCYDFDCRNIHDSYEFTFEILMNYFCEDNHDELLLNFRK